MRMYADRESSLRPVLRYDGGPLDLRLVIGGENDERPADARVPGARDDLAKVGCELRAGNVAVGVDHSSTQRQCVSVPSILDRRTRRTRPVTAYPLRGLPRGPCRSTRFPSAWPASGSLR